MQQVAEKPAPGLVVPEPREERSSPHAVPATQPNNLMQALAIAAADPRMDVAKVEKLWVMHKEMMDREREALFNEAMVKAQSNIEPVAKDRRNDHTKSTYATLAAIAEAI